jgi:hypothetical protein
MEHRRTQEILPNRVARGRRGPAGGGTARALPGSARRRRRGEGVRGEIETIKLNIRIYYLHMRDLSGRRPYKSLNAVHRAFYLHF